MVAKVIDALIVTLGLDSSGYQKGSKEAVKQLGNTRNAVVKSSNEMGKAISGAARSFALAFLGFSTVNGLVRMLGGLNEASRQLYYISKNTGVSAQNLKNYGNAFAVAGGTMEGFLATIEQLQQLQGRAQMTGVSGWEKFLNVLNVGLLERGSDGIIRARDKLKVLTEISDALVDRAKKLGRPSAYSFASEMGFDPATINVLLQGSDAIRKLVAEQQGLVQNQEAVSKGAVALRNEWTLFTKQAENTSGVILQRLQPAMTGLLKDIREFAKEHQSDALSALNTAFTQIGNAIQRVVDLFKILKNVLPSMEIPDWLKDSWGWFTDRLDKGTALLHDAATGKAEFKSLPGLADIPGVGWKANREKYFPTVVDAAQLNGIPVNLLEGIINRESHWNTDIINGKIRSSKGAVGIAQLMPGKDFPNAGKNPEDDIFEAAKYLARLKKQFGSWEEAAAAYNAGPGKLNSVKAGRIGLPDQTQKYVDALFGAGAANRVAAPVGTGTVLAPTSTTNAGMTIGTINVYPAPGTADSIRRDVVREIQRKGLVNQADYGVRP